MHNFKYVTKKQLAPVKTELISIIHSVQDQLRQDFTFQYHFVGSVKNNMVTFDEGTNTGYDFDVNLQVNDPDKKISPKEIKLKIKQALDLVVRRHGYDYAEDSTRVLTIKFKDKKHSRIVHSCDFAIVKTYIDEHKNNKQQYIRHNKSSQTYSWEDQPDEYFMLPQKAAWIKSHCHWNEVKDLYLSKKNANLDSAKQSRSIYAETIHEIYQKYSYNN